MPPSTYGAAQGDTPVDHDTAIRGLGPLGGAAEANGPAIAHERRPDSAQFASSAAGGERETRGYLGGHPSMRRGDVTLPITMPVKQSGHAPIVSGSVRFSEQRAVLTHLYVRRIEAGEGSRIEFLLTDRPLSATELANPGQPLRLARRGELLALTAQFDADGSLCASDLLHRGGSFSGSWTFTPTRGHGDAVAGRLHTNGAEEFFGDPYEVDVRFEVRVPAGDDWQGSPVRAIEPTGLARGAAEGTFVRGGATNAVHHATLVRDRDLFGDIICEGLFLTSRPIGAEHLAAPSPLQAIAAAGIAGIRINLGAEGGIDSVSAAGDEGGTVTFTGSDDAMEAIATDEGGIDGVAHSGGAGEEDPDFLTFRVRFHAAVERSAQSGPVTAADGTSLPASGGDPGIAFLAARGALRRAQSLQEILPFRTAELATMVAAIPAGQHPAVLEMLKSEAAQEVTIEGGFANDREATLHLRGTHEGAAVEGRVQLHRERLGWKVGMESYRPSTGR